MYENVFLLKIIPRYYLTKTYLYYFKMQIQIMKLNTLMAELKCAKITFQSTFFKSCNYH